MELKVKQEYRKPEIVELSNLETNSGTMAGNETPAANMVNNRS